MTNPEAHPARQFVKRRRWGDVAVTLTLDEGYAFDVDPGHRS